MRIIWDADFKVHGVRICKNMCITNPDFRKYRQFFYTYEYSLYSMLQRSFCDLVLTMYIMKL